jgi:hypothetical protein
MYPMVIMEDGAEVEVDLGYDYMRHTTRLL